MTAHILPVLFALFVWWFSTGVIMFLDGLPRRTFKWSMVGATAMLGASFWGLHASSTDLSVRGAYIAFTCGLLAWGWQEISFYMGYVTGPRKDPCPEGCSGWKHFGHAIQTSLWHELAIIASGIAVVLLTRHGQNQVGMWCFMVLWWMHQSAKLNVFLGVRNLNEEFLPDHLQFLRSFLTKKPMNLLFPVSVTVSTVIAAHLVSLAIAHGADPFQRAGYDFLAAMMVLAILEHWLLVLPLPAAALWGWSLRSRGQVKPFEVEVVAGFLGAGKTTFLRAILADAKPDKKTVVLVNDFAAVGVDGSLLRERGADVVELPNGCICCSLKSDLATQLTALVKQWSPDRVLIEPSGVADVAALMGVLSQPMLKRQIRTMRVSTVIDAAAFLRDFGRMRGYFEAQARVADVLVVNKADLVSGAERSMVETTLRALNPAATIAAARFGILLPDQEPLPVARSVAALAVHDAHDRREAEAGHGSHDHDEADVGQGLAGGRDTSVRHGVGGQHADHAGHGVHDHHATDVGHETGGRRDAYAGLGVDGQHADHAGHDHHEADVRPDARGRHEAHAGHDGHHHHDGAPDFASCVMSLDGSCDPDRVQRVLERVCAGGFGGVERLKGIARTRAGWMRFDVSGGRPSMAAFAAVEGEVPRVIAIGRDLDQQGLSEAFAACADDALLVA